MALFLLLALIFACVPEALGDPVVPAKPTGVVTDRQSTPLAAAEQDRLVKRLSAYTPEKWQVLLVDSSDNPDAYENQVWQTWAPPDNTILLVIFSKQGTARLQLGAGFTAWQIKFDQVFPIMKSEYNPAAKDGRIADGVLAMAAKVHELVAASGVKTTAPGSETPASPGTASAPPTREPVKQASAADGLGLGGLGGPVPWMLVGGAVALGIGLIPRLIRRLRRP